MAHTCNEGALSTQTVRNGAAGNHYTMMAKPIRRYEGNQMWTGTQMGHENLCVT